MFFNTSCVVYIRSFTVFQAFYKGRENHYPVDSAIQGTTDPIFLNRS
jgi:hypothetical protein